MNKNFDIEEFELRVIGRRLTCACAVSRMNVASDPMLVLNFTTTRQSSMSDHPYRIITERIVAAGHRVIAFDLPHHGDRVDPNYPAASLRGMCEAVVAGCDPFAIFVEDGTALIDECIRKGWARPGRIAVSGVSRAGYCALRLAASDSRISAVAVLAPVTDWRVLEEFSEHVKDARIASLAIGNYVDALVDRPVFIAIGSDDQRVGTDCCANFMNKLFQIQWRHNVTSQKKILSSFHLDHASLGHSLDESWYEQSATFLLNKAES